MRWLNYPAIALLMLPLSLFAQDKDYPNKPVRVIVTYPPGGSIDIVSRIVFDKMKRQMGKEFVLDNRGGASGSIGAAIAATSKPDGYTLMAHSATHIANAHVYKNLPYDTLKDFIGVTTLAKQVGVLVVHPSMPVQSVQELIDLAKKHPGAIIYGSGGSGGMNQLMMALFQTMTTSKMVEVPYRGGGPATIALISGETQAMTSPIGSVTTFLKNKQLRALGVTSAKRVKDYPDIPAIAETVPGYEFTAWVGVFVPAGTPKGIVDKLNGEFKKVLADPEVGGKLNDLTLEPMHMTPDVFARRLKSDFAKYGNLIKQTLAKKK